MRGEYHAPVRTAAEGVGEAELASDAAYLKRVWTKVMERKKRPQTRYQLYGELGRSLILRFPT